MSAAAKGRYYSQIYDPLFLYAQATVSSGSGSGPNVAALMNPHGTPMELLEMRFRIYPLTLVTSAGSTTGEGVGIKLDMGDIPLVDADVPVNSFGTARDDDDLTNTPTIQPNVNDANSGCVPYTYRWRLKYPLLCPAGCVPTPLFSHLGQNQNPVNVDVIYICRSLPANYQMPAQVRVPWVGSYNSVTFDNLAAQPATSDFSSELDIVNQFRQPLELTRLTGRIGMTATVAGVFTPSFEDMSDHRFVLGSLRVRSRSGDEIARTPTPFNGLFPYGWRVWDIPGGWIMQPGEFYKVQLAVAAANATAPDATQLGVVQYGVASIGYRSLPLDTFLMAAQGGEEQP